MLIQIICAFLAITCFSILVSVPRKCIPVCGAVGAAGWAVYLIGQNVIGGIFWPNFLAAIAIAMFSHILARVMSQPVTVFFVAGVLTIVPGGSIYQMAYYFIRGYQGGGEKYLIQTLEIAGAIALAIFIMDTIVGWIGMIRKHG